MKKRVVFLLMISIFFVFSTEAKKIETEKVSDRQYWCDLTYKISYPVYMLQMPVINACLFLIQRG